MKELTPAELVQAIQDGKKVEFRMVSSDAWFELKEWKSVKLGELLDAVWQYRLAQEMVTEMVTVGDVSFPKPESEPLEDAEQYWVAIPTVAASIAWRGDRFDKQALSRGLVHRSKENAIAHVKAIIQLSGGNTDEFN